MRFPDGSYINLDKFVSHAADGAVGLKDQTDNHLKRLVGGVLLSSAFAAGIQISQNHNGTNSTLGYPSTSQIAARLWGNRPRSSASNSPSRNLNVQPTLKIRPGEPFYVSVQKSMLFGGPYQTNKSRGKVKTDNFRLLIGGFVVVALSLPDALKHSHLRFNSTNSVPVGLYETEAVRAPYAGVCLTPATLRTALAAGLELGRGECADGHQPVLKTVYEASPASPVVFDADGFAVGNRRIPNTRPKAFSKKGKPLTHYAFGTYTAGLWAISGYNRDSFDSRYFGPVSQESLRFYAKPLFVF